jgi:hypothetical protein
MLYRLTVLYLMRNVRTVCTLSLLIFVAIFIGVLDDLNFELVAALKVAPLTILMGFSFAFVLLWSIWMVNVWVSAKKSGCALRDFVMGPQYLDLLTEDSKQED